MINFAIFKCYKLRSQQWRSAIQPNFNKTINYLSPQIIERKKVARHMQLVILILAQDRQKNVAAFKLVIEFKPTSST